MRTNLFGPEVIVFGMPVQRVTVVGVSVMSDGAIVSLALVVPSSGIKVNTPPALAISVSESP